MPAPEVFYKRKPELPLEELQKQSRRIRKLAKELDHIVWIDTTGEVRASQEKLVRAVMETFGKRPA